MNIISNCPLCEEKALHIIGEKDSKIQQCIACGYVTNSSYKGEKDKSDSWKSLTDDMKSWTKEALGYIWIPSIMTLPDYMLYPFNDDDTMKWGLAEMKDIPKEEQKDYPIPTQEGKFYERKYDTDDALVYEKFYEALSFINQKAKQKSSDIKEIKLPKIKNNG